MKLFIATLLAAATYAATCPAKITDFALAAGYKYALKAAGSAATCSDAAAYVKAGDATWKTAADVQTAVQGKADNAAIAELTCDKAGGYTVGAPKSDCTTTANKFVAKGCTKPAAIVAKKCAKVSATSSMKEIPETASGATSAAVACIVATGKIHAKGAGTKTYSCPADGSGNFATGVGSCALASWGTTACKYPNCAGFAKETKASTCNSSGGTDADCKTANGVAKPADYDCVLVAAGATGCKAPTCANSAYSSGYTETTSATYCKAKDSTTAIDGKIGDCTCTRGCGSKTLNGKSYTCKLQSQVTATWVCAAAGGGGGGGGGGTGGSSAVSVFAAFAVILAYLA